jgi:hypothetical protein
MARRVLIVGHSGLIGKAVLLVPSSIEFVLAQARLDLGKNGSGDSLVSEAVQKSCTGILNLAWQSNNSENYDLSDIHSRWQIAMEDFTKVAVKAGLKIYLVGTCLDNEVLEGNSYVSAKSLLKVSLINQIQEGLVTWFRPFFIISLLEMRPRIIRGLLEQDNTHFTVQSPSSTNDYVLVEDVAAGIILSIEEDLFGEIDLGSGVSTSNLEIVKIVSQMHNIHLPALGKKPALHGAIADMQELKDLGWLPRATIKFLSQGKND